MIAVLLIAKPVFIKAEELDTITVTPVLQCDTSVKKTKKLTCNLLATLSQDIDSISFKVKVDSDYFTVSEESYNLQNAIQAGTDVKVASFEVQAKNKAGSGDITVSDLSATKEEKTVQFTKTEVKATAKVLNNDSNLTAIKIDGSALVDFSSSKLSYSYTAKSKEITLDAELSDRTGAKLTGTGKKTLSCGVNKYELKVTAEDETTKTYKVEVTRTCSDVSTLKGISLSAGTLSPSFDAKTTSYTITVPTDVDRIKITADKQEESQTVTGEGTKALQYGENKVTLKVTSESGKSTSYTLTITREDGRSKNNNLSNITLSQGTLLFDPNTLEYHVKVLYDITSVVVTATPEDAKAKVSVTGGSSLVVGENKVEIKVIAENGDEKKYIVYIEKLNIDETLGNNPEIATLEVQGYDLGFVTGKNDYTLKIEDEDSLELEITMMDPSSTYQIIGNENLKNGSIITIKTQSADGTTSTYNITIEKASNLPLIIIFVAIILLLIAIIAFIIIKLRKNKPTKKEETKEVKEVKTTVLSDEELLNKVENQLKSNEEKVTNNLDTNSPLKPISIIEPLKNEQHEETRRLTREEIMTKMPIHQKEEPELLDQEVNSNQAPDNEPTKICSICGHRVKESLKVCPYCRRTW